MNDFQKWLIAPKKVLLYPHPHLRVIAQPVTNFDCVKEVGQAMLQIMYESKGIGLAAPQVGLPYRIFVVNQTGDKTKTDKEKVLINPIIEAKKGRDVSNEEGCLSLPKIYAQVVRPKTIKVTFTNLDGEQETFGYDGMMSRIVQHECDHLNGVLFIDKLDVKEMGKIKGLVEAQIQQQQATPEV